MGSLDGDTTDTIHVANNLSNAVYNSNHIRPWSFQTRTNKNKNELSNGEPNIEPQVASKGQRLRSNTQT